MMTVCEPSLSEVTKSAFGASATLRLTVRSLAGAKLALTVKSAAAPSVTALASVIVITGGEPSSLSVISTTAVPEIAMPRRFEFLSQ